MLISIIIPVYNVEKYIETCILSCLNQIDFPKEEFELIIINDGSSDDSLEIINNINWGKVKHTIYSQPNQGLSVARNVGLNLAIGKYVWFVDSDDWIASDSLKTILKYIDCNVDAVSINAADVKEGEIIPRFHYDADNNVYTGKFLIKHNKWYCAATFTIYQKRFLIENGLKFLPGIFHEDMEFTPRAYYLINSICIENKVLYYVRHNPASITRTFNSKKNFDLISVALRLNQYKKVSVSKKYKKYFNQFISIVINNSFIHNNQLNDDEKSRFIKTYYDNRNIFFNLILSKKIKYIVEGLLFYLFPTSIITIYNFLKKI